MWVVFVELFNVLLIIWGCLVMRGKSNGVGGRRVGFYLFFSYY